MSDYQLGQRVRYSEHIERRGARPGEFDGPDLFWDNKAYPQGQVFPGGEGIIIGKRTLSNGNSMWLGPEEGNSYKATEHLTAYLIVSNLHRKPVHVLPEHITAGEATQ